MPPALADAVIDALARAPFTAYVTLLDLERGAELDGVGIKRFPEVPRDRAPHKLF